MKFVLKEKENHFNNHRKQEFSHFYKWWDELLSRRWYGSDLDYT